MAGPVQDIVTDAEYLDVTVPPDTAFLHPVPDGHTAFAYVFEGSACLGPWAEDENGDRHRIAYGSKPAASPHLPADRERMVRSEHLALFADDGGHISVQTHEQPARMLLVSGRPLGEPVAWRGPIVMNTQEELRQAFQDYHGGTFIKRA